jgi:CubicO group peptidase (beta-lactamase class C family)
MLSPMLRPRLLSVFVVSLVLGTAACSAGASTQPDPIEPGTGAGVLLPAANGGPKGVAPADGTAPNAYTTTKITEGMIRSSINKLDDIAAATMKRSGVPGMATGVVHGGKVLYAKGFGVREAGKPDPVTPETVFQAASVSKSVSSTCICAAVTDKVVSWSDPVVKYLPASRCRTRP